MPHWKTMFDPSDWLYAHDLDGKEHTLTIERVTQGELVGEKGRKSRKPAISFVGAKKRLAINKTNGKTIAALYGPNTDDWAGKRIAIYPTTTMMDGEQKDCIRVRPRVPTAAKGKQQEPAPQPEPQQQPEPNEAQ